jgi:hypothetical protein
VAPHVDALLLDSGNQSLAVKELLQVPPTRSSLKLAVEELL